EERCTELGHAAARTRAADRLGAHDRARRDLAAAGIHRRRLVGAGCRRLGLNATLVHADATQWQAEPFDAVLLDAPCSSTGTIRRHPDIPWLKSESDLAALADLQRRLLDRAVELTKPGRGLVFCTCSLQPEEGEDAIAALLARDPRVRRQPFSATELSGLDGLLTPAGDLRTLPCHWPDPEPQMAGLDGFYAVRLQRV